MTAVHSYDVQHPSIYTTQAVCTCGWVGDILDGDGRLALCARQYRLHAHPPKDEA